MSTLFTSDPLSLTRAACVTRALAFLAEAWWARLAVENEKVPRFPFSQNFSVVNSPEVKGWVLGDPPPFHEEFLIRPALFGFSAESHSYGSLIILALQTLEPGSLQPFILFPAFIFSLPSLWGMFAESWKDWYKCLL